MGRVGYAHPSLRHPDAEPWAFQAKKAMDPPAFTIEAFGRKANPDRQVDIEGAEKPFR
jgi:hypothetical protein